MTEFHRAHRLVLTICVCDMFTEKIVIQYWINQLRRENWKKKFTVKKASVLRKKYDVSETPNITGFLFSLNVRFYEPNTVLTPPPCMLAITGRVGALICWTSDITPFA